jgi:hypothetical protein
LLKTYFRVRPEPADLVLLVALDDIQSGVIGLLHPEPARKVDIEHFREVPFLRLAEWPIVNGAIRTEWVISSPTSKLFPHAPIRLWFREGQRPLPPIQGGWSLFRGCIRNPLS